MIGSENNNQTTSSGQLGCDGKTTEFPQIKGLGTAKVDGQTVYDGVSNFSDKAGSEANAAVEAATIAADNAARIANDTARSAKDAAAKASAGFNNSSSSNSYGYHYPGYDATKDAKKNKPVKAFASWGIWVGVILVSLGTLIFLDMLSHTVPALENIFGGYSFWSFWPILIIFAGLVIAFSPTMESPDPRRLGKISALRFFEGAFCSTVGIVFLGNSLGYVAWGTWIALLSFWPLLLVIGGLAILSHGLKTQWFSVLSYVLSIIVLISVAASMWTGPVPLAEPLASLAQFGSFRGMDIFSIGTTVGENIGTAR